MTAPDCVRLLLVEDDSFDAERVERLLLRHEGPHAFALERVSRIREALERLSVGQFEVVLLDLGLPDAVGLDGLARLRTAFPALPIIVLTGARDEHMATASLRAGAQDYIEKDAATADKLARSIRYSLERAEAEVERASLTTQLLQGQKIQAVGQLAAGIAHEINNPLSYVLSNFASLEGHLNDLEQLLRGILASPDRAAELVARTDVDFLLTDFREALRDCKGGADRIRAIVKTLRGFSHPDEGRLESAEIEELLETSLQVCAHELKYRVTVNRDYGKAPKLKCYPQQIEQVFVNLLVNGAQAIGERGEIFISTHQDGGDAVIRIRDTGSGIAPQHLAKLFHPFFTTKSVGKGTGLGLHVAHKIVTGHGGSIAVRSEVGRGTEFTVRLPFAGPSPHVREGSTVMAEQPPRS